MRNPLPAYASPAESDVERPPQLHTYTGLAFLVTRLIDSGNPDLSYREVFEAADQRRLLSLLQTRYGPAVRFDWVLHTAGHVELMEHSLLNAAAAFEGRIGSPTGPVSGLCLVLHIILEAIQQNFCCFTSPPLDQPPAHPFLPFINRTPFGGHPVN